MKIREVGAKLFNADAQMAADRQTGRHEEANSRLSEGFERA